MAGMAIGIYRDSLFGKAPGLMDSLLDNGIQKNIPADFQWTQKLA
jgi:hypothetical protein